MLCDRCGKNNASYFIKSTANNKTTQYLLCSECAAELGMAGAKPFQAFSAANDYKFGGSPFFTGYSPMPAPTRRICPVCGASAEEITKTGYAGCSECYRTFADLFSVVVTRLHGRASHSGRVPHGRNGESYRQRAVEKEIKELKAKMDEAVKTEDFELAAKLRDKINGMRSPEKSE